MDQGEFEMNLQEDNSPIVEKALLVSRYSTPLAVLLVASGIVLSQPQENIRNSSIFILLFGLVFNLFVVRWLQKLGTVGSWVVHSRVFINVGINTALVYLLGDYWPPMWLLLALTPIATAVYDSRARTLITSAGVSAILLAIQASRTFSSPLEWGVQFAQIAFIFFMSLFVNDLVARIRFTKET